LYLKQWYHLNKVYQTLRVSLRGLDNDTNIEHPQSLLRV